MWKRQKHFSLLANCAHTFSFAFSTHILSRIIYYYLHDNNKPAKTLGRGLILPLGPEACKDCLNYGLYIDFIQLDPRIIGWTFSFFSQRCPLHTSTHIETHQHKFITPASKNACSTPLTTMALKF